MTPENRARIEREIVTAIVTAALQSGYEVGINNGGDDDLLPAQTVEDVLSEMFTTDSEALLLRKDLKLQVVELVYGNDGWDVIADYSTSLETLLEPAHAIAAKYQ